jgi:coenzyme PQQ precursor peptide PqqA
LGGGLLALVGFAVRNVERAMWVKPTFELVELGCEVTSYSFRR